MSAVNAPLCTVVPVYLTMFAVARIGPSATAQMSMLGPVSLLFLGHWVLGEPITPVQLLGTGVVLAGLGAAVVLIGVWPGPLAELVRAWMGGGW